VCGAGGGVGTAAVQLLKSSGALIVATTGESSIEATKKHGAKHVFNYKEDWVEKTKQAVGQVDVVLDLAGGPTLSKALPLLKVVRKKEERMNRNLNSLFFLFSHSVVFVRLFQLMETSTAVSLII
jgi:threonine dehydrogenase-like Zn-dependent dehydrogenase